MQANRSQTPEQRLAQDLGLTVGDLERVVRDQRARDRAGKLVELARLVADQDPLWPIDWDIDTASSIVELAGEIMDEIDAPIGGA